MAEAIEVAVASGGDEEVGEDVEVVAGVEQGGGGDGAEFHADVGEGQRDTEENTDGPDCVVELRRVQEGEEQAGEHSGDEDRGFADAGGGLPLSVGLGSALDGEPVVGGGDSGKEKAAEGDLFE